jgi:uncharacterized membrane protein YgcG
MLTLVQMSNNKFFSMERQIRFLMIAITLALISSCSKKPLQSSKYFSIEVKETPTESVEWIDNLKYDDKSQIAYGIFNNDSDLVIRVLARDQATIMKMFMTGFTVWIDTTGGKEGQFGVKYPLAQGRSEMDRDRTGRETGTPNQKQSQEKLARLQTALNSIEIIGFSPEAEANVELGSKSGDGICAWINLESEMDMYYELKIPLNDLAINDQKMISIGFESGSVDMPSGGPPGGGKPGGGMNPGGGGPPGGGGRSGGGGGQQRGDGADPSQGQSDMKAMSQAIDLWIKRVQLSKGN